MVTTENTFLIDSTFLLNNTHETFFGTPLLQVDGRDDTFIYGFLRDFLRLIQALSIKKGVLVIGKGSFNVTNDENIQNVLLFLRKFGVPIIYDPKSNVLDISFRLLPKVICIITKAEELFQLEKKNLIFISPNGSNGFDFIPSDKVNAKIGVNPNQTATLLTLTKGPKSLILTKGQAIRLIELYGDLDNIFKNLPLISSDSIQKKLSMNKDLLIKKHSEFVISKKDNSFQKKLKSMRFDFNNEKNVKLLESRHFYSLTRLLIASTNVNPVLIENKKESTSYIAVRDRKGLEDLESLILSSAYCALDTESSDKNPHLATLYGISFSISKGKAFYVPLIENDLKDIIQKEVVSILKRILEKPIKFVGHNIKYDYLLLRRHGIKVKDIHFDTMLAAYDCFGDWDFFNLAFLSKKLIGKEIKSYKDIVESDQTFLDLPFKKIVNHGCEDADITLQLFHILKKELEVKKIAEQHCKGTLRLMKKFGDLEYNGILIKPAKLENIRNVLLGKALAIKQSIWKQTGREFDPDSQKEIAVILKEIPSLNEMLLDKKISLSILEQLAVCHAVPKLIVYYKRVRKQIKIIDSIAKAVLENKLFPNFNQIKSKYGQLSSTNPNIFESGISDLKTCFNKDFQSFFKDSKKALKFLEDLSKDVVLKKDRLSGNNLFMENHHLMKKMDSDEFLLSLVIGFSDFKLSKRFLIDRLTVSTIRHELEVRYSVLFQWIESYQHRISQQGFASIGDKCKYLDGLKSSNIEKRKNAKNFAIRWLIHY